MPTVDCKLTDCSKRGQDTCIAKRVAVDGVGQVECYDPVPRSKLVHEQFDSGCHRHNGKWKSSRVIGVLK